MTQNTKSVKRSVRSRKRQLITVAFLAFIVYVLLLSGIFSYFHSEDLVTNRYKAQNTAVRLLEPEWDSVGMNKAKASEPGMVIPKDPYAKNEGQNNLYIRLKMTVSLGRFDASGRYPEYAADFNNDKRRLNSILNAIEMKNENTISKLFGWNNQNDSIENWTLKECYNKDYYMEDQGSRTLNDGTTEQVFYFYYVNGKENGEDSEMRVVEPQKSTTELFDQLQIPVLKKDYLGVFDQNYNIAIEAQAVAVTPSESSAVSVQKTKFN
ncbi:hypothetical protein [Ruminococcus sp.]|uniref:hypothetical protein n=1 Tax=Ruminococcus sp. TaxID=41978 RepID=UPI0025CF1125|nr:hypothetical protein [Ruminococcus sp.]